jgi:hypothetical protein
MPTPITFVLAIGVMTDKRTTSRTIVGAVASPQ